MTLDLSRLTVQGLRLLLQERGYRHVVHLIQALQAVADAEAHAPIATDPGDPYDPGCLSCEAGGSDEIPHSLVGSCLRAGPWRVGRSVRRTLYVGDQIVGLVDTPELAAAIVARMNELGAPMAEVPKAHPELCQCATCVADFGPVLAVPVASTAGEPRFGTLECCICAKEYTDEQDPMCPHGPRRFKPTPAKDGEAPPERVTLYWCRHGKLWQHAPSDTVSTHDYVRADIESKLREQVVKVEAELTWAIAYQNELSLRLESVFAQLTAAKAELATARERAIRECISAIYGNNSPQLPIAHVIDAIQKVLDKKGPAT
jgi:hypothetical protein